MSSTDEPSVDPITSGMPGPSIESVKSGVNTPRPSIESVKLSEGPDPSVEYVKKGQ